GAAHPWQDAHREGARSAVDAAAEPAEARASREIPRGVSAARADGYFLYAPLKAGARLCAAEAGTAEAAGTAGRVGKGRALGPLDTLDALQDQLRHAIAVRYRHRLFAQVDDEHHDLATVIGIDGARCVDHREPLLEREAAPRPHLHLVA